MPIGSAPPDPYKPIIVGIFDALVQLQEGLYADAAQRLAEVQEPVEKLRAELEAEEE